MKHATRPRVHGDLVELLAQPSRGGARARIGPRNQARRRPGAIVDAEKRMPERAYRHCLYLGGTPAGTPHGDVDHAEDRPRQRLRIERGLTLPRSSHCVFGPRDAYADRSGATIEHERADTGRADVDGQDQRCLSLAQSFCELNSLKCLAAMVR